MGSEDSGEKLYYLFPRCRKTFEKIQHHGERKIYKLLYRNRNGKKHFFILVNMDEFLIILRQRSQTKKAHSVILVI